MNDRELLEAAARAAGIRIDKSETNGGGIGNTGFDTLGNAVLDWHNGKVWNPLKDDGDALRLAVKLGMHVGLQSVEVWRNGKQLFQIFEDDKDHYAATRRAIVRAAAALSPATPQEPQQ